MMISYETCLEASELTKQIYSVETQESKGNMLFFYKHSCGVEITVVKNDLLENLYVVFRGSESWTDWKYNFRFWSKNLDNNIRIHNGLYKQIVENFDEFYDKINKYISLYPNYNVYVTGHSIGAAQSTVFSYMCCTRHQEIIPIISFCGPKIGNKSFSETINKFNIPYFRFTQGIDIIPNLPFYGYTGYIHTGIHFHVPSTSWNLLTNHGITLLCETLKNLPKKNIEQFVIE